MRIQANVTGWRLHKSSDYAGDATCSGTWNHARPGQLQTSRTSVIYKANRCALNWGTGPIRKPLRRLFKGKSIAFWAESTCTLRLILVIFTKVTS